MKLIFGVGKDHSQLHIKTVEDDFDVDAWAKKREHNFKTLGIQGIVVKDFKCPECGH